MTTEGAMAVSALGYLACILALAALAWPWYRRWTATQGEDWRGEGGTEGQR